MAMEATVCVVPDADKSHPSVSNIGVVNHRKIWQTDLGLFFEYSKEMESFAYSNVDVEIITLKEYGDCSQEKENSQGNREKDGDGDDDKSNIGILNGISKKNKCPAGMYECQVCPKFYESAKSLRRHVDHSHPSHFANLYPTQARETIYRCHVCYAGFDRRSYVGRHLKKAHPDVLYRNRINDIGMQNSNSSSETVAFLDCKTGIVNDDNSDHASSNNNADATTTDTTTTDTTTTDTTTTTATTSETKGSNSSITGNGNDSDGIKSRQKNTATSNHNFSEKTKNNDMIKAKKPIEIASNKINDSRLNKLKKGKNKRGIKVKMKTNYNNRVAKIRKKHKRKTGVYKCELCPKHYPTEQNLRRHVGGHHPDRFSLLYPNYSRPRIHPCPKCSHQFDRKSAVERHFRNCQRSNNVSKISNVAKSNEKKDLHNMNNMHNDAYSKNSNGVVLAQFNDSNNISGSLENNESIECTICLERFSRKCSLRLHVITEHSRPLKVSMLNTVSKKYCSIQKSSKQIDELKMDHVIQNCFSRPIKLGKIDPEKHQSSLQEEFFVNSFNQSNQPKATLGEIDSHKEFTQKKRVALFEPASDCKDSATSTDTSNTLATFSVVSAKSSSIGTLIPSKTQVGKRVDKKQSSDIQTIYSNIEELHLPDTSSVTFQCKICKVFFKLKTHAVRHVPTHFPARFSCDVCGRQFQRKDKLRYHMENSHRVAIRHSSRLKTMQRREHRCRGCKKVFREYSTQQEHTKSCSSMVTTQRSSFR